MFAQFVELFFEKHPLHPNMNRIECKCYVYFSVVLVNYNKPRLKGIMTLIN